MTRITLDAENIAKLKQSPATVAVCDESGNVIGHFLPNSATTPHFAWQPTSTTPEERAAGLQEYRDGKCLTAEQVRARLAEVRRDWEARQ